MKKLTLKAVVSKGAAMRYNKIIILKNGMECFLNKSAQLRLRLAAPQSQKTPDSDPASSH